MLQLLLLCPPLCEQFTALPLDSDTAQCNLLLNYNFVAGSKIMTLKRLDSYEGVLLYFSFTIGYSCRNARKSWPDRILFHVLIFKFFFFSHCSAVTRIFLHE
jgi:hypothetical protein